MELTNILTYLLGASAGMALLSLIAQLFMIKVWVSVRSKRDKKLTRIGYLKPNSMAEVPEVRLPDKAKGPAMGRIKVGENHDDNAYVEILLTDPDDESVKPQYATYGYISQDGFIYMMPEKNKKPKKIGYTARPSDPESPIATGERNWRSLWLKCTLNAYLGTPEKQAKNSGKQSKRRPDATATYTGIHSSKNDAMPPEARGAAFGVFYNLYNKNDYREHYSSPTYGWKDTALLSAFIYAVLYCLWYIVTVKVLGLRFIGYKFWQDIPLYFIYYAIWAIVRAVKIECISNSDTIQPKIDLFNKIVGQKGFDILILICCCVTLAFSGSYYRFDFLPLASVLMTAIGINFSLRSNKTPWKVTNPFTDEEDNDDKREIQNPRGDIERLYKWALENDKDVEGNLALYFDAQYVKDLRFMNPFFNQRKDKSTTALVTDMFGYVKRHSSVSARSRYIVKQIKELAGRKGLSEENTLQFILDFVQEPNIRFVANRESESISKYEEYIRYPDEVLYDKEGDSNSKAFLAVVLMHFYGYNVVFLYSRLQQYGAIGIEMSSDWEHNGIVFGKKIEDCTFDYNGKTYIFCETSADGFRIGGTLGGMSPGDFDEKVEIPLIQNDGKITNEDTKTCLFNWDLDGKRGNKLHGTYTIEFVTEDMDELRKNNPFTTYGEDNEDYQQKVKRIFQYLDEDKDRTEKVRELALYIKKTVSEAGLDEVELIQFALDFCQTPNIQYKIDEESTGINYSETSKEYMRFPDEVIYDKEGDCDCKSSLAIALFKELGYKSVFMISDKYSHAAVGVEYKSGVKNILGITDPKVIREINGVEYIFCETTGDGYRIGEIKDEYSIQNFETVVEIA